MAAVKGSDGAVSVSEFIARFPPDVQRLLRAARRMVKEIAPESEERACRGWPMTLRTGRGLVALAGYPGYVNLSLGKGVSLRDPEWLLKGTGKSMRHVKVRRVEDARSRALQDLVRQELLEGPERLTMTKAARERIATRVRRSCLARADVSERLSHGSPTFFHRDKRSFLQIQTDFHDDGRFALWLAAPLGAQGDLVEADPERYFVPPYVGPSGWVGMRLDREIDWDEVGERIGEAYVVATAKGR